MSRRIGHLTHVEEYIDPMPSPASYVSKVQVEARVFYPPNADLDHVLDLLDQAFYKSRDEVLMEFLLRPAERSENAEQ